MEQISYKQSLGSMVEDLESLLARIAVAADAGMSTYYLEDDAMKLSSKLKESSFLENLRMYKDVDGLSEIWRNAGKEISDENFMRLAKLCKIAKANLSIYKRADDENLYVKFDDGIYIDLSSVETDEMPSFLVKLEGDNLIAIRKDLFNMLPSSAKKLLGNKIED